MKIKATSGSLIFILFLFSLIFISNEIKARERGNDSTDTKLKNRIDQLEKKMQDQQNAIDNLKKEIDKLKERRPWLAVPKIEGNDHFRKGRRFEFNGQIYYMVPLNSGKTKNTPGK